MKFATDQDAKFFLIEIEELDNLYEVNKSFQPSEQQLELFLKKRKELVPKLKNFRRRQNTKQQWRQDKYKMMKGIKRFHKSTAGKKFHRALGRFLATRESMARSMEYTISLTEIADILRSMASLKTHAFIELEFYHPIKEDMEYRLFIEELIPTINKVEKNLLAGCFEISSEDEDFLLRLVKEESLIYAIANRSEFEFDEIREEWKRIISDLKSEYQYDSEDEVDLSVALSKLKYVTLEKS